MTLPTRNDIESEDPTRLRPLIRFGPVELQRNGAEQQARADAAAHARNAIGRLGIECHAGMLSLRPGDTGVCEEEKLGRDESGCQPEFLCAEQRDARLSVEDGNPRSEQAI